MSMITDEVFDRVIALSELELEEDEKEIIKNDMEMMVEFFDILREVDMGEDSVESSLVGNDDVEEMMDTSKMAMNVFREDVVTSRGEDSIIQNAPELEERFIVVPKTVK